MKSKVWTLTKVFLKCSFANMGSKIEKTEKKQNPLKGILVYSFLIIYMGVIMGFLSYGMISSLKLIRTRTSIFKLIFLSTRNAIFHTICNSLYERILFFKRYGIHITISNKTKANFNGKI